MPDNFDTVLAEHESAIRYYVRSLLPGYHGVEDITQEVMVTVWQKRSDFTEGTNFKAWAFRIAQFHVLNQRRKIARGKWLVFDQELIEKLDPETIADSADYLNAEEDALEHCLKGLNAEDQKLLHTRYATKTSVETFAQQEGLRPGTLKARLFRLRAALRTCIEEKLKNE